MAVIEDKAAFLEYHTSIRCFQNAGGLVLVSIYLYIPYILHICAALYGGNTRLSVCMQKEYLQEQQK